MSGAVEKFWFEDEVNRTYVIGYATVEALRASHADEDRAWCREHDAADAAKDARIRELEAALEPFARLVDHANRRETVDDAAPIWIVNDANLNDVPITQGDVRRAHALLHPKGDA